MAKCPYAPHRMVLSREGYCQRCNGDLRLYAAVRWLPEMLFNDARKLAEKGEDRPALELLARAMALRIEFPEARLLMAFLEARQPVSSTDAFPVSPLPPQHCPPPGQQAVITVSDEIEGVSSRSRPASDERSESAEIRG